MLNTLGHNRVMGLVLCLLALCLVWSAAGCTGPAEELPGPEEVEEIVAQALYRGEAANLLYLGDFSGGKGPDSWGKWWEARPEYVFTDSFETQVDLQALLDEIQSVEDIQAYFRGTFVPALAERYIGNLFSPARQKYTFEEGQLYLNGSMPMVPLSLITWEREVQEILEQTEDTLVVSLRGRYMLTGNEAVLPLRLQRLDGQWLLDESFSPVEYDPDEGFYTPEEAAAILHAALENGDRADDLNRAGFSTTGRGDREGYTLIDLTEVTEEQAKDLQSWETVQAAFREIFLPAAAERCIQNAEVLYRDTDRGLAENLAVAAMPLSMSFWDEKNVIVYRNTEDAMVFLVRTIYSNDVRDQKYCPLRLFLRDGLWKMDSSYMTSGHSPAPWDQFAM